MTNVVDFGPRVGQLRVTALASTSAKPMDDFVPRRGDGRFFGLNIIGVSQTTPPKVRLVMPSHVTILSRGIGPAPDLRSALYFDIFAVKYYDQWD